jgi:hypothetical protein
LSENFLGRNGDSSDRYQEAFKELGQDGELAMPEPLRQGVQTPGVNVMHDLNFWSFGTFLAYVKY